MDALAVMYGVGVVKSVQRGVATGSGSIVINEVNINKTYVDSKSKGSAGTVATNSTIPAHHVHGVTSTGTATTIYADPTYANNGLQADAVTLSGGTTDLTVKEYSARLTDSTHIYVDGPVEYQVIEFY